MTSDLPVPRDALVDLGLNDDDIALALASAPRVIACQAPDAPGARFDVDRVHRVLTALSHFRHTKGRWAGRRIRLGEGLDAWQIVWIIAPVFGWVRFDAEADREVRVIDTAWVEVPRKNGKSTISSAILNVLLLADGEMGAEVYAAAGSTEQAARVGDDMKRMCLTAPQVRGNVEALKNLIRVPGTGSMFRVLSRVAETAHGLNVSGACIDEVHTLRLRRALVEAIETGTGARDQPLVVFITTADEAETGTIYDEKRLLVENIATRTVTGPAAWAVYGVVWRADESADPWAEETWLDANPGTRAGASPTMAYLRREAAKAKASPSKVPAFMRLHLNVRTRDTTRWIDLPTWDTCGQTVDRNALKGRPAYMGLDLGAVRDFSALWIGVTAKGRDPQAMDWIWRFWLPEERLDALDSQLHVPLRQWIADGYIELTEGDVVDYDVIEEAVVREAAHFDVKRLSFDRMFAGQMMQHIEARCGIEVAAVNQTYLGLSPALKEMERMVRNGHVSHGGNPVARWMASVTEVAQDNADNVKPVKPDRHEAATRIDGIAAAVTGMDGWVRRPKPRRTGAAVA